MKNIIGIDEVGRGAWAGPLVVGAVMLNKPIAQIADSKTLTKVSRIHLAKLIYASAAFTGLGWVSASEVDDLGLTKATTLACKRAIVGMPQNAEIIIDGKINYLPEYKNCGTQINGDATVPAISAASIIAKVARDLYMAELELVYPGYNFSAHVGYGTERHIQAIKQNGLTPLHRLSYKPIQAIINNYET